MIVITASRCDVRHTALITLPRRRKPHLAALSAGTSRQHCALFLCRI